MGKFLSKDGLTYLWRSMRTKFDDCITRIFWDSSSEIYMYDTMGQDNNDFPIQAVNGSDTKPGLMTPEDKKTAEYYKPRFNKYIEVNTENKLPTYASDYVSLGNINDGFDLENPEYQSFDISAATTGKAGVMSARDKRTVKTVQDNGFMTNCSFATNSAQYKNMLQLSVTTVPKNAGASEDEFIVKQISYTPVPVATTAHDGAMSSEDKQILNDIASFGKSTTNPLASHPFVCDYCDLMDVDIVMTVGDTNLWCATVLLNDTEDQTYVATYNGQVLERKPYRYQYPNTPQGDITTWFIPLPKTAAKGSCTIGVS